jgi:hypothetical protein
MTLVLKNAIFFAENWRKLQKNVTITSSPDHVATAPLRVNNEFHHARFQIRIVLFILERFLE